MNGICKLCNLTTPCSCQKGKISLSEDESICSGKDSGQRHRKCTPDKKNQLRFSTTFNSPLQTIPERVKNNELQCLTTPTRSNISKTCNPFDVEVDSLSMSSFSPSVFTVTRKKSQEGVSFRWSIEQLAVLEPADIDETSQQHIWVDSEKENKAQEAIDTFFSKNHIAPSPWTPTVKCVTFTPQLTSSARRLPVAVRRIPQKIDSLNASTSAKEVSTQTCLSIPPSLNLLSLLAPFYTYHENVPNSSSEHSYCDVDVLSTSSLRRKLFMNEDNKLESPALIKEQNKDMLIKCNTPDLKISRACPTPSSDHFSSSPITPRNWSLSLNHVSMSSPTISPICSPSKKSPPSGPDSKMSPNKIDHQDFNKIEKLSSTLKRPLPDNLESRPCFPLGQISEIDIESSCNTTWDMSKQDNIPQQENCDQQTFPNNYSESSSNQRDTGYLTGSLNSMVSQQLSSYMQCRTTPVTELLEDCAISKLSQQLCSHQSNIGFCTECAKIVKDDETEDSAMVVSLCQDQSSSTAMEFKSVPWHPNNFSTPTKYTQCLGLS